jgi:hypothetical protein
VCRALHSTDASLTPNSILTRQAGRREILLLSFLRFTPVSISSCEAPTRLRPHVSVTSRRFRPIRPVMYCGGGSPETAFFLSRACFDPQLQSWIMHLGFSATPCSYYQFKKKLNYFYCVPGGAHISTEKRSPWTDPILGPGHIDRGF